jgi:hypothetical protein
LVLFVVQNGLTHRAMRINTGLHKGSPTNVARRGGAAAAAAAAAATAAATGGSASTTKTPSNTTGTDGGADALVGAETDVGTETHVGADTDVRAEAQVNAEVDVDVVSCCRTSSWAERGADHQERHQRVHHHCDDV